MVKLQVAKRGSPGEKFYSCPNWPVSKALNSITFLFEIGCLGLMNIAYFSKSLT